MQFVDGQKNKGGGRLPYIDNLRLLACFLVLMTHSTMPASNPATESFWMFTLSFIGSPSSELFLALSGAVLLPIYGGIRSFYIKRFRRILYPVIFWSIVGVLSYYATDKISIHEAGIMILKIPLQPVVGVYWFIYVMVGLYLFAPVISAFLKSASKRQLEFFLAMWSVTLIMPWAYGALSANFNQSGSHYWMLNYFGGFLGYWVLGFYLIRNPIMIGINRRWLILCLLTVLYPCAILLMKLNDWDTGPFTDNLQFGSAVLVAFLFTLFQKLKFPDKIQSLLTSLAKYSFGIYLIHFFLRDFFWNIFRNSTIHIFPRTILIALLMMTSCTIFVWIISKLPFGRRISGLQ